MTSNDLLARYFTFTKKWHAPLLASDKVVTELIHLIDPRQASNPILILHLLDCLEVEVAKPCLLPPSLLMSPCKQAHMLCYVAIEHIELIAPA
jgi:hypothetical protein